MSLHVTFATLCDGCHSLSDLQLYRYQVTRRHCRYPLQIQSSKAAWQDADVAFEAGVPGVQHLIHDVPVGILQAAILAAENAPDLREDRVQQAMLHLGSGTPDSEAVAQAMISTIVADSSR